MRQLIDIEWDHHELECSCKGEVMGWEKERSDSVIHDEETYWDEISVLISEVGLSSNLWHLDLSL